jgi:hypothetical protein
MIEPTLDKLTRRLDRLERENRRLSTTMRVPGSARSPRAT